MPDVPAPFNPNTSSDSAEVGFPVYPHIYDIENYTQAFLALGPTVMERWASNIASDLDYRESLVKSQVAVRKAINLPPEMQSFARITLMPETHNGGVIQWPGIPPEALRKIARECLAPQTIIAMRTDDVLRYAGRSIHPWKPGWRIVMRKGFDVPDSQTKQDIKDACDFIENCNFEITDPRLRDEKRLTDFPTFLSELTRDSLTYDGMAVWTDIDLKGRVLAFRTLSAFNIRLTNPATGYQGDKKIFAVGVDEAGNVVETFTRYQLIFRRRNPRADADIFGYGYPEAEQAVRLIQGFQNAFDMNADVFCYTEDTEVLTNAGWKRFDKIDMALDSFATLNTNTGGMEYQKASEHVWTDYDGDVYWLKSRSVDLIVTPNHRVITQYRPDFLRYGNADYVITRADELHKKLQSMEPSSRNNYCVPTTSSWEGTKIGDQWFDCNPPHYAVTSRRISGDDYCAFMGMYLAEGNTAWNGGVKGRIDIHQQRKSKGFEPFRALLTRILEREPGYCSEDRFYFSWHGLAEHCRTFGENCYEKRIPQIILDATPRQQKIFWDYYSLGDGHIQWAQTVNAKAPHRREKITTVSRVMADQLQELAQKMGFAATISSTDPTKYDYTINGRSIKSTTTRFDVNLKTSKMQSFETEKAHYKGKIGCVMVPNGTLYVRRNGKAAWCGNTRNSMPNGFLTVKGIGNQKQLDILSRIWMNLKRGISKSWAIPVIPLPKDGEIEIKDLGHLKDMDAYYQEYINMVAGLFCAIYRFPPHRLGYKITGKVSESKPNESTTPTPGIEDYDPYISVLLQHHEQLINPYILWTRWPHLELQFTGKSPKEDAREYEARILACTVNERRALSDLPKLEDMVEGGEGEDKESEKKISRMMGNAPVDPALAGVYQALVVAALAPKPTEGAGPEARMSSKKDPAKSEAHGHMSGVRRDSASEEKK